MLGEDGPGNVLGEDGLSSWEPVFKTLITQAADFKTASGEENEMSELRFIGTKGTFMQLEIVCTCLALYLS